MNYPANTDWRRLVAKTRRRPLIWCPAAVQALEGAKVRSKPLDLLIGMAVAIVMGVPLTWLSFHCEELWSQAVTLLVGVFLIWTAVFRVLFPRSVFIPTDGDEIIVRYGFFLLPRRLVLDRQSVAVDYQLGAETKLPRGWGGLKIVSLRHVETQEVAHLGYSMKGDDALRVFDVLSGILAEGGRNASQAVVTLHDGSLLQVGRLATWAAGHKRRYTSQFSVIAENMAEIRRTAFLRDRSIVDRAADVHPVRIETNDLAIRIIYSNHEEKFVSRDDCVALQLCKEEVAGRRTRYEINLIVDPFKGNRVNLMSFDFAPLESPREPRQAAEELGQFLNCEVADHL